MGNNVTCNVVKVDTIRIKIHYDNVKSLIDVRHVLALKNNLIFVKPRFG